jgi:hypothetical protein
MFNNDYFKIGLQILRPKHRETNQRGVVKYLTGPLNFLNSRFFIFRQSIDYIQLHDSRKIHIEKVLNDKFDNVSRRIFIDNVVPEGILFFYNAGEDRPVFHYDTFDDQPVHYYQTSSIDVSNVNFIVNLPLAIQPSQQSELVKLEIKINTQVDRYKVASKTHKLLWIN